MDSDNRFNRDEIKITVIDLIYQAILLSMAMPTNCGRAPSLLMIYSEMDDLCVEMFTTVERKLSMSGNTIYMARHLIRSKSR